MHTRYLIFGATLLSAIVISTAAWLLWRAPASEAPTTGSAAGTEKALVPLLPPRQAPVGYKEYRDGHYRFALFYPEGLAVEKFDEGGGAATFVFQNPDLGQGFQIFVLPYSQQKVSEAQFMRDAPSGVMREPTNVSIDGAGGTMFFGISLALGETREVWFIHDGYLFEVTTMKPLDAWLGGIMNTWLWI